MLRSSKPAGLVSLRAYNGIPTIFSESVLRAPFLAIYGHYRLVLQFTALMTEVLVTLSLRYVNHFTQSEVTAI